MKVSFVSSHAISQAMRYQSLRIQADMSKATTEMVTGRSADVGVKLGARAGMAVSFSREIDRMKGLIDSNSFATTRLSATQIALKELTDKAGDLMSAVTTAISTSSDPAIIRQESEFVLATLVATLNTNLKGEFLFAGINTDVKPLSDFNDPTSTSRQAFEAAFVAEFGFGPEDPATAGISVTEMNTFLDNIEVQFTGADWNTHWSTATNQQITSRITISETAQTSVSANISGFRKLAMAASTIVGTFGGEMTAQTREVVLQRAMATLGEALSELSNQQGLTGISEQRVTSATERMEMQIGLLTTGLHDLEGVDEFEAANKVKTLEALLEISYSLTARMQQMSLLRYL